MLRGRHDDGKWSDIDRIMAMALTLYESGLCSGCGMHRSVTHGDHNMGRFETGEEICHGCEPVEAVRDSDKKDTYPGKKLTIIQSEGWE